MAGSITKASREGVSGRKVAGTPRTGGLHCGRALSFRPGFPVQEIRGLGVPDSRPVSRTESPECPKFPCFTSQRFSPWKVDRAGYGRTGGVDPHGSLPSLRPPSADHAPLAFGKCLIDEI